VVATAVKKNVAVAAIELRQQIWRQMNPITDV
jgi:hypothetical protein